MNTKEIISACGNDCSQCPRHLPKTEEDLQTTAELWFKIGYRDRVVSNREISCTGCCINNWCRYEIIKCVTEKNISTCGSCSSYPCTKIEACFSITKSFAPECRKHCNDEEFARFTKAFFEKKENLDFISMQKGVKHT